MGSNSNGYFWGWCPWDTGQIEANKGQKTNKTGQRRALHKNRQRTNMNSKHGQRNQSRSLWGGGAHLTIQPSEHPTCYNLLPFSL